MSHRIEHQEVHVDTTPNAGIPVVEPVAVVPPPPLVVEPVAVVPPPPAVVPVVAQQPIVVQPAATADRVRTSTTTRFAPDSLIAAGAGVVLLLFGLVAIARGGFDGPMSDPIVKVLGFGHTTSLGLIEIGFGLALLIAGVTTSRGAAIFFGATLAIAAFVGAVQTDSFDERLGLESSFAWLMVALGSLVVLAGLLLPRIERSSTASSTHVY
jgi:hypothetical protein